MTPPPRLLLITRLGYNFVIMLFVEAKRIVWIKIIFLYRVKIRVSNLYRNYVNVFNIKKYALLMFGLGALGIEPRSLV
jgi:hypothetical protein